MLARGSISLSTFCGLALNGMVISLPTHCDPRRGHSLIAELRAAKRSPILIWERKGNPSINFLMVIMASGIARGRVRTTATESRKMGAIIQIIV